MKFLRNPIRAIREPFGTAGLVVACVALVLALTGAAFAAGALTSKQKKEVEKIAKKYAGKPGAPGATGPAGAAGPQGAKGPVGAPGEPGEQGERGPQGPVGPQGPQGEPWPAGGTLPSGAVEKGDWTTTSTASAQHEKVFASVSFQIPLASQLPASKVHVVKEEESTPSGCTGNVESPGAEVGNLCIFTWAESNVLPYEGGIHTLNPEGEGYFGSAGKAGTQVTFYSAGEGEAYAYGTWAVTGP